MHRSQLHTLDQQHAKLIIVLLIRFCYNFSGPDGGFHVNSTAFSAPPPQQLQSGQQQPGQPGQPLTLAQQQPQPGGAQQQRPPPVQQQQATDLNKMHQQQQLHAFTRQQLQQSGQQQQQQSRLPTAPGSGGVAVGGYVPRSSSHQQQQTVNTGRQQQTAQQQQVPQSHQVQQQQVPQSQQQPQQHVFATYPSFHHQPMLYQPQQRYIFYQQPTFIPRNQSQLASVPGVPGAPNMINVVQQPSPQQLVHQTGVSHPNGPQQQQQVTLQQQLSASHQQQLSAAHQLQQQQVVGGSGGVLGIPDVDGSVVDASGILSLQTPTPSQMLVQTQAPTRKRNRAIQIIHPDTGKEVIFKGQTSTASADDVNLFMLL